MPERETADRALDSAEDTGSCRQSGISGPHVSAWSGMNGAILDRIAIAKATTAVEDHRESTHTRYSTPPVDGHREPWLSDSPETETPGSATPTACAFSTARGRRGPAVLSAAVQVEPGAW